MQAEAASGAERSSIVAALRNAAAATQTDFHYLLGTAMRESSLKPGAQSATSSAAGLFQFIDQTWLGLVKEHGARHGLGGYADAIRKDGDGHWRADTGMRASILALRKDPQTAAMMAGEYAKATQTQMRTQLGRDVCGGELYAAHFLGPDAACRLIRLSAGTPAANAATEFPLAASANHSVFYRPDGSAKSVREVYDWALRQPGDAGTLRLPALPDAAAPAATPPAAHVFVAQAQDTQIRMLLAGVMNWQPGHGSFGALFGNGDDKPASSPLSLGAGLLNLLSDARGDAGS